MAKELETRYPDRFRFHKTRWAKFPDGTDDIEVCVDAFSGEQQSRKALRYVTQGILGNRSDTVRARAKVGCVCAIYI